MLSEWLSEISASFKARFFARKALAAEQLYRSDRSLNWLIEAKIVNISQAWGPRAPYMKKAVQTFLPPNGRLLEVGTWMGCGSTQIWLAHLPTTAELICIDKWGEYVSNQDHMYGPSPYRAMDSLSRTALNVALNVIESASHPNVIVIKGSSAQALTLLKEESFDFVFIDGSHYYADVKADLQRAKALVKDGGILCGDDLEFNPENDLIAVAREHLRTDCICLPDGRCFHPGVLLAVSEEIPSLTNYAGFWICRKNGDTFDGVQL